MANCSISLDQLVIKLVYLLLVALFETVLVRQTQTIQCFRSEIWRLKLFIKVFNIRCQAVWYILSNF